MDWLSDFFARINNGYNNRRRFVYVINSRIVFTFIKLLYKEGFISGYSISTENFFWIVVILKYVEGKPVFKRIVPISTSGRRVYVSSSKLTRFYLNKGFFFLSTSRFGIIPVRFLLKKTPPLRIGGELISQLIL